MPIPTELVGSLPRPMKLQQAYADYDEGKITFEQLQQEQDAAAADSINRLEQTGEAIVTDGEQRESSFATYSITDTLAGTGLADNLAGDGQYFAIFDDGHHRQLPRLTGGPFRYKTFAAEFVQKNREIAGKPVKQAVISPSMMMLLYPLEGEIEGYPREQFLADVCDEVEIVLRDTVAGTTELVSRGQGPAAAQALDAGAPSISGDGDCVAFETSSDAIVAMPPGTDFSRVVARAVRGDCPFGPVPVPPGGGPGPGTDTTAPVVSAAGIKPRRFLAGKRLHKRTATRPAIGGRLRFTLSEAAAVGLKFARLRSGRRLRGRCVAPRRAPGGRRCTRALTRGKLSRVGVAGANRVAITGRLRGRKLEAGSYRITLHATDAAGNVSAPARVRFTVLRAP